MDPLSIAASVAGLLTAAAQISTLLSCIANAPTIAQTARFEMDDFASILTQLQPIVAGISRVTASRASMVEVEQLQLTLTGCVRTFSELHAEVHRLSSARIGVRDRIKWAWAQSTIELLVRRLQSHKSTLTLMLCIITWYAPYTTLLLQY